MLTDAVRSLMPCLLFTSAASCDRHFPWNVDACNNALLVMDNECGAAPTSLDCDAFDEDHYPYARCDATPYFDCLVASLECDKANDTVIIDSVGCAPLLVCVN